MAKSEVTAEGAGPIARKKLGQIVLALQGGGALGIRERRIWNFESLVSASRKRRSRIEHLGLAGIFQGKPDLRCRQVPESQPVLNADNRPQWSGYRSSAYRSPLACPRSRTRWGRPAARVAAVAGFLGMADLI